LLLQWSFLEMIPLLFLPRLPLGMDLLILMDINITICLNTWLMLFKIYILYLLLKVEVEVKVYVLMYINIRISLNIWLMLF
jgi:hypothetical protein